MTNQFQGEITSDDKLWAMLCYVLPVVGPVVVLLMQGKKDRPFIKAHFAQSLVLGIIMWVANATVCGGILVWIYAIYLGVAKAYAGQLVTIPLITDLCKNQGWA